MNEHPYKDIPHSIHGFLLLPKEGAAATQHQRTVAGVQVLDIDSQWLAPPRHLLNTAGWQKVHRRIAVVRDTWPRCRPLPRILSRPAGLVRLAEQAGPARRPRSSSGLGPATGTAEHRELLPFGPDDPGQPVPPAAAMTDVAVRAESGSGRPGPGDLARRAGALRRDRGGCRVWASFAIRRRVSLALRALPTTSFRRLSSSPGPSCAFASCRWPCVAASFWS